MKKDSVMKKLFKYIGKYWILLILSIILAGISVVLQLYVPVLFGNAIDEIVVAHNVNFTQMWLYLKQILLFVVIAAAAIWIMNLVNNRMTYHIVQDIRSQAIRHIQKLPLSYLDQHSTGDIVSRIIADTDILSDGLLLGFTQLFSGVVTVVVTLIFMFSKNVWITLMVILLTPLSFLVAKFISSRSFTMFKKQSETRGKQTALIEEMIGNQKVVKAFGYEDKIDTDIFGEGMNYWDNPFSNSSMLLKLSNGAIARISENRRIAWGVPETYISNFHGTKASYECSLIHHSYIKVGDPKPDYEDVSDLLNPIELSKHKDDPEFVAKAVKGEWASGEAPIQIINRIPDEIKDMETNHAGTHKFMVDDFCQAYMSGKLSPTNAWQAARYNLPGLTAHISATEGGVTMDVPDLGNPPEGMEVLSADRKENEVKYK